MLKVWYFFLKLLRNKAGGRRQEAGGRRQEAGGRRQEAGGKRIWLVSFICRGRRAVSWGLLRNTLANG